MQARSLLPLPLLAALLLAGCAERQPLTAPDAGPVAVAVLDNDFQPSDIRANAGQPLRFENLGQSDHTVTIAREGSGEAVFDQPLAPGAEVEVPGLDAGRYRLRCTLHSAGYDSGQVGSIVVA